MPFWPFVLGATDEDIAVSVRLERGQNTPGLWAHILPDHVRRAMLRRLSAEPRQPTCQACGDAGMIWETGDIVCWCPNDCGAAREERRKNPKFMDDWTTYVVEAKTCQEPRNSSGSDEYRPEGGRISGEHSFQTAAPALPRIPDVCGPLEAICRLESCCLRSGKQFSNQLPNLARSTTVPAGVEQPAEVV